MQSAQIKKLIVLIAVSIPGITTVDAQNINSFLRRLQSNISSNTVQLVSDISNNTSVDQSSKNAPCIQWQKCIGGKKDDYGEGVIKLADGNYLICGSTNSHNGNFDPTYGNYDAFLIKTDGKGNIIWQQTYGGSKADAFYGVTEMKNGDILAIGTTSSDDQQVSGNHGGPEDIWLVKTNANGKLLQQHCYGGSKDEDAAGVTVSNDGSILFAAETNSKDGDVSNNHGNYDGWIVKLNPSSFAIEWQVTIGDTAYDNMDKVYEIKGNFLVTGTKASVSSKVPDLPNYYDAHAALLDQSGHIIWYHRYGGSSSDDCNASVPSGDGNAVLTGHAASNDGDVTGNYGFNMWTFKIDVAHNGNIIWQNFIGVPKDTSAAFNIAPTQDGGFVVVGAIAPNFLDPLTTWNNYAAKMDRNGNVIWTKQFGGSDFDALYGVVEENDKSILVTGATVSNDGDVSGNHGGPEDIWLANLGKCDDNNDALISSNAMGKNISITNNNGKFLLANFPNPFSNSTSISFTLPQLQKVSLQIFDINGRLIKTLANEQMQQGVHQIIWNATNENGSAVANGMYYLKLNTGDYSETKKLSLIK